MRAALRAALALALLALSLYSTWVLIKPSLVAVWERGRLSDGLMLLSAFAVAYALERLTGGRFEKWLMFGSSKRKQEVRRHE